MLPLPTPLTVLMAQEPITSVLFGKDDRLRTSPALLHRGPGLKVKS